MMRHKHLSVARSHTRLISNASFNKVKYALVQEVVGDDSMRSAPDIPVGNAGPWLGLHSR